MGKAAMEIGLPTRPALDRVLAALLSKRGTTLVTLAVGMASRASTATYCEYMERASVADAAAGRPDQVSCTLRLGACMPGSDAGSRAQMGIVGVAKPAPGALCMGRASECNPMLVKHTSGADVSSTGLGAEYGMKTALHSPYCCWRLACIVRGYLGL